MGKKQKMNEAQHTEPGDIRGLDERSMIREQDRLARENRKRKNRKKKRISGAIVVVALAGGIWYFLWGKNLFTVKEETAVNITAASGQQITYARLTSVKGNEITYALAQVLEEDSDSESVSGRTEEMPGSVSPGESGRMDGQGRGGKPSGDMSGSGEDARMPAGDMSAAGGSAGRPAGTETGGGLGGGSHGFDFGTFTYDGITCRVTEETVTARIPVGTEVTTKLGTVTTFSRLAAGDYVALVTQKDGDEEIIVAVYIIG